MEQVLHLFSATLLSAHISSAVASMMPVTPTEQANTFY